MVRAGAAVAALGSLLSLILGVSGTTLAMARDRHLPAPLAAVHAIRGAASAEVAVGALVAVLACGVRCPWRDRVLLLAVLGYYAIANAWRGPRRLIPVGLVGTLAAALPLASVLVGRGCWWRADPGRRLW